MTDRTPHLPEKGQVDTSRMTVSQEKAIEIRSMNKWYGDFHVLRDIDLDVFKGERIVICGPSGSGKSTVAVALEDELLAAGRPVYLLDGDNLRHGLNGDLGFSAEDRHENVRRVGEVARLFADAGQTLGQVAAHQAGGQQNQGADAAKLAEMSTARFSDAHRIAPTAWPGWSAGSPRPCPGR